MKFSFDICIYFVNYIILGDEDRKRICGPPPDISEKLEEEMASLGDDHRINIVEALRNLSKTLIESLKDQEGIILQVFARW